MGDFVSAVFIDMVECLDTAFLSQGMCYTVCVCGLKKRCSDSAHHINTFNWLLNDIIKLRPVQ